MNLLRFVVGPFMVKRIVDALKELEQNCAQEWGHADKKSCRVCKLIRRFYPDWEPDE